MRFNKSRGDFFLKHKDTLIMALLVVSILLGFFNSCGQEKNYVLTEGKEIEAPELERFCSAFIDQIINKSLHREMVEPDIYDVLVADNYSILKLLGHENALFSRSTEQDCSIIIKDRIGLRRFDIKVNKSKEYPFFYRVQRIDEPKIEG